MRRITLGFTRQPLGNSSYIRGCAQYAIQLESSQQLRSNQQLRGRVSVKKIARFDKCFSPVYNTGKLYAKLGTLLWIVQHIQ